MKPVSWSRHGTLLCQTCWPTIGWSESESFHKPYLSRAAAQVTKRQLKRWNYMYFGMQVVMEWGLLYTQSWSKHRVWCKASWQLTIPHLELVAGHMAINLSVNVCKAFEEFDLADNIQCWLDNTVVLHWLNDQGEYCQFMANRVKSRVTWTHCGDTSQHPTIQMTWAVTGAVW